MKMLTVYALLCASFFLSSPSRATQHSDCTSYCDATCKQAIENEHDQLLGCSNYGYAGSTVQIAATNYCRVSTGGYNQYTLATQECNSGSCHAAGQIRCFNGSGYNYHQFSLDCGIKSLGGLPKMDVSATAAHCSWSDGSGVVMECNSAGSGVLTLVY